MKDIAGTALEKYLDETLSDYPPDYREWAKGLVLTVCNVIRDETVCKMCGACCCQEELTLTDNDVERITEHLNLKKSELVKRYLKRKGGYWIMRESKPCSFYDRETKKCRIYDVRPEMCNLFPVYSPAIISSIVPLFEAYRMKGSVIRKKNEEDNTCFPEIYDKLYKIIEYLTKRDTM